MFDDLLSALRGTGIEFAESAWVDADRIGSDADYGIIAVDGAGDTVWADDGMQLQAIEGTVDLFTHGSGRTQMETIQTIFDSLHIAYTLNSVQYESDTHLTHWEWVFQLESM